MTLRDTIRHILSLAMHEPCVSMIVEQDIYRLNELANRRYGVFAYTEGVHPVNLDSSFDEYRLVLFYVDRIREDQDNTLEIHSTGIDTIGNVLRGMMNRDFEVSQYSVQPFTERFKDNCAGVFAEVSISSLRGSICKVPDLLVIYPQTLRFAYNDLALQSLSIFAGQPWQLVGIPDNMNVTPTSGEEGNTDVSIAFNTDNLDADTDYTLQIVSGDQTAYIVVTQEGYRETFDVADGVFETNSGDDFLVIKEQYDGI